MSANPTKTLWDFLVHILVATILFGLIATPAVGLSFLIKWLETNQVSEVILIGLELMEYAIFFADIILLLVFLAKSTYRAATKL